MTESDIGKRTNQFVRSLPSNNKSAWSTLLTFSYENYELCESRENELRGLTESFLYNMKHEVNEKSTHKYSLFLCSCSVIDARMSACEEWGQCAVVWIMCVTSIVPNRISHRFFSVLKP